jgi:WD repeat-containing protein 48
MRLGTRISQRNIDVSNCFRISIPSPNFTAVNLGRWVLANLFSGFIREEVRLNTQFSSSNTPIPLGERALHRSPAPMFINLDRDSRRSMSESSVPSTMRTPGITTAMASPSMAPAMLPDVPGLAASPLLHVQTTLAATHTPAKDTQTPAHLAPPKDPKTPSNTHTPSNQDYFSLRLDAEERRT